MGSETIKEKILEALKDELVRDHSGRNPQALLALLELLRAVYEKPTMFEEGEKR